MTIRAVSGTIDIYAELARCSMRLFRTTVSVPLPHSDCSSIIRRYPIPKSSIRSSGVPHRRQMIAAQSPHTSGSVTPALHFGQ